MYRPEGWKERKRLALPTDDFSHTGSWAGGYEAGADAYEKGLIAEGRIDVLSYEWCIGAVEWANKRGGYLVFIPEGKE